MSVLLKYPKTVDSTVSEHKNFLAFTASNYKTNAIRRSSNTFGSNNKPRKSMIGTTYLYMPEIGEVSYTQNYDNNGTNLLQELAQVITGDSDTKIKDSINVVSKNLGGGIRDTLTESTANNQETARYESPALREQNFSFNFSPRNIEELREVARIIDFFKEYSAPYYENGNTQRFKFPAIWSIEELKNTNETRIIKTFKFGPAMLTKVSINQTPRDYWLKFANGDPCEIDLSLDFTETGVIARDDLRKYGL